MVWSNILSGFVLFGCLSLFNCQSVLGEKCKPFAPPKHGAAKCIDYGNTLVCTVACKDTYDFAYKPAMLYMCTKGKWDLWSPSYDYDTRLPWPDCSRRENPAQVTLQQLPQFYYKGDCNDPNVQAKLKQDYVSLITYPTVPPFFCKFNPQCRVQNVKVHCGMCGV